MALEASERSYRKGIGGAEIWGIGTRPSRGRGVQCPRLRLQPVVCLGGRLSVGEHR